jgi:hypothetical protein
MYTVATVERAPNMVRNITYKLSYSLKNRNKIKINVLKNKLALKNNEK